MILLFGGEDTPEAVIHAFMFVGSQARRGFSGLGWRGFRPAVIGHLSRDAILPSLEVVYFRDVIVRSSSTNPAWLVEITKTRSNLGFESYPVFPDDRYIRLTDTNGGLTAKIRV